MRKYFPLSLGLILLSCSSSKESRGPASLPLPPGSENYNNNPNSGWTGSPGRNSLGVMDPGPPGAHQNFFDPTRGEARAPMSQHRPGPSALPGCPDLKPFVIGEVAMSRYIPDRYGRRVLQKGRSKYTVEDLALNSITNFSEREKMPTVTGKVEEDRAMLRRWFERLNGDNEGMVEAMHDVPLFQVILRYLNLYQNSDMPKMTEWAEYYGAARLTALTAAAISVVHLPECRNEILRQGIESFSNDRNPNVTGAHYADLLRNLQNRLNDVQGELGSEKFDENLDSTVENWEDAHERYVEARERFDEKVMDDKELLQDLEEDIEGTYARVLEKIRKDFGDCGEDLFRSSLSGIPPKNPIGDTVQKRIDRCAAKIDREIAKVQSDIDDTRARDYPKYRKADKARDLSVLDEKLKRYFGYKESFTAEKRNSIGVMLEQLDGLVSKKKQLKSKDLNTAYRRQIGAARDAQKKNSSDYVIRNLVNEVRDDLESLSANPDNAT